MAIADASRVIKSNSSSWIHDRFPDKAGFAWQSGYEAFSVSYSNLASVKRYIAGQEEHHRPATFKEEFLSFLERHEIRHDERFLWD